MKFVVQRLRTCASAGESGMTLIEVVVAISLVAIISASAIGLSITSQKGTSVQQRQELAVTIASEAMEAANAQSAATNPSTGMSYLYQGRTKAKVEAAWMANPGVSGLANTYMGWDTAAVVPPAQVLPISKPIVRNGTEYTVFTLIGICYMPTTSAGGDCTKIAGSDAAPPATVPADRTALNRVIVVVRWKAGSGCAASGCSYQTTTLVDAHDDLLWNTH